VAGFTGALEDYALVAPQKERGGVRHNFRQPFVRAHLGCLVWKNVDALKKWGLWTKPWPIWEDLELCNAAAAANLFVIKERVFLARKFVLKHRSDLFEWDEDTALTAQVRPATRDVVDVAMSFLRTCRIREIVQYDGQDDMLGKAVPNGLKLVTRGATLMRWSDPEVEPQLPPGDVILMGELTIGCLISPANSICSNE